MKKNGTVHCTKIDLRKPVQDLRFFFATIFMNHPSGTEIWEDLWTFPMILGRKNFIIRHQSKFVPFPGWGWVTPKKMLVGWWFGFVRESLYLPKIGPKHNIQVKDDSTPNAT